MEMKDGIAMDEAPAPRKDLLRDMQNNGVRFCTETSVQEVTDHSSYCFWEKLMKS